MATRVVDEREHRRGLVLGLSLAEVLLLLLFLVMLAFSIPLMAYDKDGKPQESASALNHELERLKSLVDQLTGGKPTNEVLQKLKTLAEIEKEVAGSKLTLPEVKDRISALKSYLGTNSDVEALKALLQEATRINPDDPPASLRQASGFLRLLARSSKPENTSTLSSILQDEGKLGELAEALKRAKEIDPLDPVAALKKRLEPNEDAFKSLPLARELSKDPALPSDPKALGDLLKAGKDAQGGKHNWPPIITLSEADGCFFKTGSAVLDECLRSKLRDTIVPLLLERIQKYDVDVIEVIGHTDEQPIVQRLSNLDLSMLGVIKGNGAISTLTPADNAGLGLARGVAVVQTLLNDHRIGQYRILPLSGGQLIGLDERLIKGVQGDIQERRRIEIRLRRSQQTAPRSASQGTSTVAGGPSTDEIRGIPRIIDADTVQIGTSKIRLVGIDAPETGQICLGNDRKRWTCGIEARDRLIQKAGGKTWSCRTNSVDRYGRGLATCEVDGININRWLVREGWALSFVRYSHEYDSDEAVARQEHAGLWSGAFIAPWNWRNRNKNSVILGAVSVPIDAQSILLPPAKTAETPSNSSIENLH
jgi:endonuclease YncB( thermonuclease family)/flagellar motor protein MotB